jgi:hypothetical protein
MISTIHIGYETKEKKMYKIYMDNHNIIGLEEETKKLKGFFEFSFKDKDYLQDTSNFFEKLETKKRVEAQIIVKDARNNKRTKSRGPEALF